MRGDCAWHFDAIPNQYGKVDDSDLTQRTGFADLAGKFLVWTQRRPIRLGIVKKIVEAHGGEISFCQQNAEKGVTFKVRLPVLRK